MDENVTLTQEQQKFFLSDNNYIEYFFEIGIKPNIFQDTSLTPGLKLEEINSKLFPEIISKFPYFDKKSMTIDSNIIDFIAPKGFKAITSEIKPKEEFYSIMIDNPFHSSDYSYKYIGCLVIYESLDLYKKVYNSYAEDSQKDLNKSLAVFKNIYIPKYLCLASVNPNINIMESILRAIYDLVLKDKNYFIDVIIEKLICQTPKVPRGIKQIFLKIDDKNINLTEKKLNELSTINVDLKSIFSNFKIEAIVDIFKLMLFEIKIIFFGSKKSEITNYILGFILLLKPFTYQYRILSILPKKYYIFLQDENPCIFGVNELYTSNFFKENNIIVGTNPICIVDLDKKNYYYFGTKNMPVIPNNLKIKLDKRTEEYKKNKKKTGEKSEEYQDIFYRFMINLLKDYPKFLKKNIYDSNKLQDLFDTHGFISAQSSTDKDFFDKIINSKMFLDLIIKRLKPRDTKEKIQALFFEEKINVKIATKKIIGGNKILEQNILLPSKSFDYDNKIEIIDLTGKEQYTKLDEETINFFNNENINKEVCLPNGYKIHEGKTKSEIYFEYYLFPELLSEKLFKYNCNNYSMPQNYNLVIEKISEEITKNRFIKIDDISKNKSGDYLDDILISYVILFILSFPYMDKEEREPRFNNLLQIISRIDNHDMVVLELLFNSLIRLKEEELAIELYNIFNEKHINLSWNIFLSMSKILNKRQNIYTSLVREMKVSRDPSSKLTSKNVQNNTKNNEKKFRQRSIKLKGIDDDILGEEIFFDVFGVCLRCKSSINLDKICEELSPKDLDKNNNRFRCQCGDWNIQKLRFRIGTELYNKKISSNFSSHTQEIILYSPTNLKKKLFHILSSLNNEFFKLANFRKNYPEEFWNSVWYLKLKEIDISFMLPYASPVYMCKIRSYNRLNNLAKFTSEEQTDNIIFRLNNNEIKNPNIKIRKLQNLIIKFNLDTLYIQKVQQISILKFLGMVIYKPDDSYGRNNTIKGNVIKGAYIKKKIVKPIEKKNKNNDDSILFSTNIITSDFEITTSTSTNNLDKSEEINIKEKEMKNIDENEINRNTNARLSNEDLFEHIREDDENYQLFQEYKEDNDINI